MNPETRPFLVFGALLLEEDEIQEVIATLRSGWIGTGPKVARFEEAFRAYRQAPHAVAVSSCTAALHLSMAARRKLKIIEDCAHAIEAEYHGTSAGTFGDFGCFSFYVTKNMTTGEGGMVLTRPEIPPFVSALAAVPGDDGFHEGIPSRVELSMYHQTIHEKPIAFGWLGRSYLDIVRAEEAKRKLFADRNLDALPDRYKFRFFLLPRDWPYLDRYAAYPRLYEDATAVLMDLGVEP